MLGLQPDEALNSFYSRSIFFFQNPIADYQNSLFGFSNQNTPWTPSKAAAFTNKIGWTGRKGFSLFLHRHTTHHRYVFAVDKFGWYDQDIYRKKSHPRFREYVGLEAVRFCPLCIREDYESLGFAYWRRSHQDRDVAVCAKHNVILVSSCEKCSRPYNKNSNYLDVLWAGCDCGFNVLDTQTQLNLDSWPLMVSRFLADLYSSEYQVYWRDKNNAILHRVRGLGLRTLGEYCDYFSQVLRPEPLREFSSKLCDYGMHRTCGIFSLDYKYMAVLFSSFDELSSILDEVGADKYPLSKSCHTSYINNLEPV